MGEQFDKAVSMREICKAIKECKRGVSYKDGPMEWYLHSTSKAEKLQRDIKQGKYKLRPGTPVQIYRPKRREAIAPWFRDCVWQRSMCNNGVYDDLTRSLCYDNVACQKGKGTDLAIRRTIKFMQQIYRETGTNEGWGVHLDVHKYFPMTPHAAVKAEDAKLLTEPKFLPYIEEIVDSIKDTREMELIRADTFGERGTGLGSQINQLNQVALLNGIDHRLKCFCDKSERYMDDFLIIDKSKDVCIEAERVVTEELAKRGLECVNKSGLFRLSDGFYFLRHYFKLTDTGKVILRLHPDAITGERAALQGMKRAVDRGEITMEQVRQHYQCWIAQAEYASGDGHIRDMDKFYTMTFRQKPVYKRKRRYLYGGSQNAARAGSGRAPKERGAGGEECGTGGRLV